MKFVPGAVRSMVKTHAPQDIKQMKHRMGQWIGYYRGVYKDKRTPLKAKLLLSGALAYLFSPFDILPDFIPFFGQLDDLVIVPFLFGLANKHVPQEVKDHWRAKYKLPA